MDTITTIIVTVLANAIVTGLIVYFIQKRMENSFAKNLEEFRSHLAYSNFEKQQRFSAMHPKRIETLEILYKKFHDFDEVFGKWTDSVIADVQLKGKVDLIDYRQAITNTETKLRDFLQYFELNRIFLPQDSIDQIEEIFSDAALAHGMVNLMLLDPEVDLIAFLFDEDAFKDMEKELGKTVAVMYEVSSQVSRQIDILKKLYKSVAEAQ